MQSAGDVVAAEYLERAREGKSRTGLFLRLRKVTCRHHLLTLTVNNVRGRSLATLVWSCVLLRYAQRCTERRSTALTTFGIKCSLRYSYLALILHHATSTHLQHKPLFTPVHPDQQRPSFTNDC